MPACSNCGKPYEAEALFCPACGTELSFEATRPRELRKTVTVVFSDVANSTRLGERLDPESHRRVMSDYFDAMRAVLERHGGTVEKFIGDAVMAVFGIPVLHEDDALRAVRAASDMREAVATLNRDLRRDWDLELSIRTGVNTGEVVAGESDAAQTLVTGDAVVVAKRLEESADPDEIQLGESTYRLVREAVLAEPLGAIEAKGKPRLPAWRMLEMHDWDGTAVRLDSPLVGRTADLKALIDSFELAEAEQSCRLFTVVGPAGIGKSRLVHEFVGRLGDRATVLRGRCLPYGDGITFWPLVEVVRQAAELTDRDSADEARRKIVALLQPGDDSERIGERVATAVGRGEAATARPDETFWAVRRLFESLARERPLVVVVDDLQWAESTLLDLIEYVAGWATQAPLLVCCLARPDLLELRPSWGLPRPNAETVVVEPLEESETDELVVNLLGRLPSDIRAQIATLAQGNPLFVEELLRMLVDEGLLRLEPGGWVAAGDLDELDVPPTIHALLGARLDRLAPEERAVIQRASVAGQVFWWGALNELSPAAARPAVGAHLQALVRQGLIEHEQSAFAEEDAFRFQHILIRDAAYAALPKEARVEMHEQLARWLERRAGDRAVEYEELVGYHLEQAVNYAAELGRRERRGALALDAEARLASAGRRAAARGDAPAAVSLLNRSLRLLPPDAPERAELLIDLADALHRVGQLQGERDVLEEALEAPGSDERVEARARLELASLLPLSGAESDAAEQLYQAAERAVLIFERLGDDRGLARALLRVADAHWLRCRVTPMQPLLERARKHAQRAGDAYELAQIRQALVRAATVGPMPVDEALTRCRETLEEASGDRLTQALTANGLALLEAMRGHFEEARRQAVLSRGMLTELGLTYTMAAMDAWIGEVELLAGDADSAGRVWQEAYETLDAIGERGNFSTIAACLAEARYLQGRLEEAGRLTEISEEATFPDDVTSQTRWRATRAKVHAQRGELATAEELAREAVIRADETDLPSLRGTARTSLAEVLLTAGRVGDAAVVIDQAVALYRAKGNAAAAAAASGLLARVGAQ
jgi:class 3 adenylate cyclase/tetratricopeptide (TPR) repeat protein